MDKTEIFKKSVLVVAHPDDEVLWFSSILNKVDEIIICFLDCKSKSWLSLGRENSLSKHPMNNIFCLGIEESEACSANWGSPKLTKFGIAMTRKSNLLKRSYNQKYEKNYHKLKQELERKLAGYHNVFTHNVWGEYGHAEHIQIYTVIKELQPTMKFEMWYSNYCSNVSLNLMLKYISGSDSEYITFETNKELARTIEAVYKNNGCWTWYDGWKWFNEESFKKDRMMMYSGEGAGHLFPLNMIKLKVANKSRLLRKIV
jgi:LmbE family N-acetylglucosaminyl deacetylase